MVTQPGVGVTTDGLVEHSLRRVDNVGHRGCSHMVGHGIRLLDDGVHRGNFGLYRPFAGQDLVDLLIAGLCDLGQPIPQIVHRAAVSAAVYVGSAVVPAAVAGPLFVGRVSATIKAAAPSTTAAIATLATAANGQLRERGGAGGWVGVHCPVVGGGGVGHPRKAIAAAVSVHSTCMPAAFGGHLGLGDRSRSVSLSGTP
ncbi:transmembrane protein [Mycobacterium tuberculosis]|nr:transmembrane protein [Mycobacterium tuberculosis]